MKTVGKVVLCVVAYLLGITITGIVAGAFKLPSPAPPPGSTVQGLFYASIVGTLLLASGLTPLAMRLGGSRWTRFGALWLMIYVAVSVNTVIEAKFFSDIITVSIAVMCLHQLLPCVLLAGALALLFTPTDAPVLFPTLSPAQWAWRVLVAWAAFPIIYIAFGMCVGPFVVPEYLKGTAGLKLPTMATILRTQYLIRSPLFLISSLPIVALWTGSRKHLLIAFGIAEAMMVGVHGLVEAYWLPTLLRVLHSIEITFDSFAYVAVLTWLFAAKAKKPVEVPSTATVAVA